MKFSWPILLAAGLLLATTSLPASLQARAGELLHEERATGAPLLLIENVGQYDARARFLAYGGELPLALADNALWYTVAAGSSATNQRHATQVELSFVGSNPRARPEPFGRLSTHVSYFRGSGPAEWHADVPVWAGVRYRQLYPGIDLEIAGAGGRITPRLLAGAGADLAQVRLRVAGAEPLAVVGRQLQLATAAGPAQLPLFELIGSEHAGGMPEPQIAGALIAQPFATPTTQPQAQQPVKRQADLIYGSYLGGDSGDEDQEYATAVAVDDAGAAYVAGLTNASDFPLQPGAVDPNLVGVDAVVAKFSRDGTGLDYATFLGGDGFDRANDIAVFNGNAYLTGQTSSSDFPLRNAFDDKHPNTDADDAFVTKLNPTGSALIYSTYLGGAYYDIGESIAVDSSGAAYVAGTTGSYNFPTTFGALSRQNCNNLSCKIAFITKMKVSGADLAYSTFLRGSADDQDIEAYDIAVDSAGATYVAGMVASDDFPATSGALNKMRNGPTDGFVAKLNPTGTAPLAYATLLGGNGYDQVEGIAIHAGAAFVTGLTSSTNFPTSVGAIDRTWGGGFNDAFVAKLNTGGTGLDYSTYLGAANDDSANGIAVDSSGAAYVVGTTNSKGFPTTSGYSPTPLGVDDAFVAKLAANGRQLLYSTFLGSIDYETGYAIAIDKNGAAYVAGSTESTDFPTTPDAWDRTRNGYEDGFIAKLQVTPGPIFVPLAARFPPAPPPTCNDAEQNDDQTTARLLTTLGATCTGSLQDDPDGEDDWYYVNIQKNTRLVIELGGPAGADYRLALYQFGSCDPYCGNSDQAGSAAEQIDYRTTVAGQYHIRVQRKSVAAGVGASYTLRVVTQ